MDIWRFCHIDGMCCGLVLDDCWSDIVWDMYSMWIRDMVVCFVGSIVGRVCWMWDGNVFIEYWNDIVADVLIMQCWDMVVDTIGSRVVCVRVMCCGNVLLCYWG